MATGRRFALPPDLGMLGYNRRLKRKNRRCGYVDHSWMHGHLIARSPVEAVTSALTSTQCACPLRRDSVLRHPHSTLRKERFALSAQPRREIAVAFGEGIGPAGDSSVRGLGNLE
jgi:hypothetical protein